jgi:hypothetical protein
MVWTVPPPGCRFYAKAVAEAPTHRPTACYQSRAPP